MHKQTMRILSFLLFFVIFLLTFHTSYANYNCGTAQGGTPGKQPHCYGLAILPSESNAYFTFDGTSILARNAFGGYGPCSLGPIKFDCIFGGFLTDETWIGQAFAPCTPNDGSWIEAGVTTNENWISQSYQNLFWADCRPGSTFFYHPGPRLNFDNTKGISVNTTIARRDSTDWDIVMYVPSTNTWFTGLSTYHSKGITPIKPNAINYGEELAGNEGAWTMGRVTFTNNEYSYSSAPLNYKYFTNSSIQMAQEQDQFDRAYWNPVPASSKTGGTLQVWIANN